MAVVQLESYKKSSTDIVEMGNQRSVKKIQDILFKDKTPADFIAYKTGLHPQTVSRMRYKETQSPYSRTVCALYRYYGYKTVAFK